MLSCCCGEELVEGLVLSSAGGELSPSLASAVVDSMEEDWTGASVSCGGKLAFSSFSGDGPFELTPLSAWLIELFPRTVLSAPGEVVDEDWVTPDCSLAPLTAAELDELSPGT